MIHAFLFLSALLVACNQAPAPTGAVPAVVEPAAAADAAKGEHGEGGHDCTMGAGTQGASDQVTSSTNAEGKTVLAAGAPLSDGQVITPVALLADPQSFSGKKVRISGNVTAMCTHARGWFAVATDDTTGRYVRVITAPTFLVPADSIGKKAEAEGVVEVTQVDAATQEHLASGHGLAAGASNVKVVLKATGATFVQ